MFMTDSGVFCHLLGVRSVEELLNSSYKGDILETFVYSELLKHMSYSDVTAQIYHYRTSDKKEIDFILEGGDKIIAIEIKSSLSIKKESFKHIIDFQKKSNKEILGIVFYGGDTVLSFSDEEHFRYALPFNVLF